jgi:hypothetical protein
MLHAPEAHTHSVIGEHGVVASQEFLQTRYLQDELVLRVFGSQFDAEALVDLPQYVLYDFIGTCNEAGLSFYYIRVFVTLCF